ncbi:GH92 family glycosyl hydrolase [Pendulispora rubella]|uniref:GH92 family glycosyl hydrolase n=1 Tax=Pendulispora rubella TaxID=2741070 RepID=A0ABZ2LH46_9BACT
MKKLAIVALAALLGGSTLMCSDLELVSDLPPDAGPDGVAPRRDARTDAPQAEQWPPFASDPTTLVDTSIGNNENGTTFPGATTPFGMVQLSPDTGTNRYAAYQYKDTKIWGFSHTHLSGVGCQTMGNFRFMPTNSLLSSDPTQYATSFSHANETRSPGSYSVTFASGTEAAAGIQVSLTATERTGWHRYVFPDTATGMNVLMEVGESNGNVYDADVAVVGNDTIEGSLIGGNFCGETGKERYRIFFSAKFDRTAKVFGTWVGSAFNVSSRTAKRNGGRMGAWLSFDPAAGRTVGAVVGVSYVSVEGARNNRLKESQGQSFDTVRDRAHGIWQSELLRMPVAGGSQADQRTFYSALYRSLLHPSIASDVDGQYRDFKNAVHTSDKPYYQMLSLWDTYRSQNQLVALLHPQRAADMARSVLRIYNDSGWMPRWALGNGETNVMSGDPITPWVVTIYRRGLLDKDTAKKLFDALWRNVNEVPGDTSIFRGRDGNPTYKTRGHVDYNETSGYTYGDRRQAGSATLEYAFADCSLAVMARGLGETEKAKQLDARCRNFEKLWDANAQSKGYAGFPRARKIDGTNAEADPYDPMKGHGFHEGTGWQYQWLVQQDAPALFAKMGGETEAEKRLDTFFDMPTVLADPAKAAKEKWVRGAYTYYNAFAFNPNNESDLHAPWMYAWTGSPWKTSAVLRAARTLFVDREDGMPGNDDLGTISSWLLFGMTGIFEAAPGSGAYVLTAPMFEVVEIRPENGRTVRIEARGADASKLQYVASVRVGNPERNWIQSWISHENLLGAETIRVWLTDDPHSTVWATTAEARPPRLAEITGPSP